MKLAVIIGHTKKDEGARTYDNVGEYTWNGKVAKYMQEYAKTIPGFQVAVFTRDKAGVTGAAKEAKKWGADACIELHFNAFTKVAYGCECLVLANDVKSAKYADIITDDLAKRYGVKERNDTNIIPGMKGDGVVEMRPGGRGYGNLNAVKAAGIPIRLLIEPCFMNTKNPESVKLNADLKGYAHLLIDAFAGIK